MASNFDIVALSSDSLNLCGTDNVFYDTLSSGRSSFVNYIITNCTFERSFIHSFLPSFLARQMVLFLIYLLAFMGTGRILHTIICSRIIFLSLL